MYAFRAGRGFIHVSYGLLSREFFMLINNVILVVSLAVVLWGTLAPIAYEAATDAKISVGPPFYNKLILPFLIPFVLFMSIGPSMKWIKTNLKFGAKSFFVIVFTMVLTSKW